jgi:endoglucanase
MFELIRTWTELDGPVGQEQAVVAAVERHWRELGLAVERTGIGNLLGRGGGRGPRLLLAAHADELCYSVRAIDARGFLWLASGQAWQRLVTTRGWHLLGQRVRVLARSGPIPGVVATTTGHLATLALKELSELTWSDFWVDTGLTRDELLAAGVTPGTRVVWSAATRQQGQHVVGKALDDRVPLVVISEVARRVPPAERQVELTLACTVQEEIGLIGATALMARERFDAAIAVEIGMAGDTPAVNEQMMPLALGSGPVLVHKDSYVHYDYGLTARLEHVAAAAGIAIQHAAFGSFGSDGAAFMRADVPAALVAFPTRYTHSPFETAHLADIEALIAWLCALVRAGLDE